MNLPRNHSEDVWKELADKGLRISDKMLGHIPNLIIGIQAVTNFILIILILILIVGYFK